MHDSGAFGSLSANSPPDTALIAQHLARASGVVTLAIIFVGVACARELALIVYAVLFAIPHAVFAVARASRKWQAWGWAIACVNIGVGLASATITTLHITRHVGHSQVAMLVFLMALLLSQFAQLILVRRVFPEGIAFGRPLFRLTLYYVSLLLVVAATLPNWYVPPQYRKVPETPMRSHPLEPQ